MITAIHRAVPLARLKSQDPGWGGLPPVLYLSIYLFIYLFISPRGIPILFAETRRAFHFLINFINTVIIFGSAADWLSEARAARVEPEIIALERDAGTKADN